MDGKPAASPPSVELATPEIRSYDEAISFLLSRINYERSAVIPYRSPQFHLARMRRLNELLGNLVDQLKIVHIAGTKGKGSTATALSAILEAAGYQVGLFSSPHLERLEERFAINRTPCQADDVTQLVREIAPLVLQIDAERSGDGPTYFEITTAMALLHFVRRGVDAAILEVGLGGRLDSTNICRPLVSVITTISRDHMALLGDTLAEIAGEKAGIIKSETPVVSGVDQPEPAAVIEQIADQNAAQLVEIGRDFAVEPTSERTFDVTWQFAEKSGALTGLSCRMAGQHQMRNSAVAIMVAKTLESRGFSVSDEAIRRGLTEAVLPGRIERLADSPVIYVDAAHNDASISALVDVLNDLPVDRRRLVLALSSDKEYREILRLLLPHFDEIWFTRYATNPRAIDPAELEAAAVQYPTGRRSVIRHLVDDPQQAFADAIAASDENDLLCVAGSFFIAGEFRRYFREM
ncbi:bifunctional folylpolyglutamate synthase/dihydrofolate synthase [Blastopirellula sp. JC732]|uniref:Dihydrofolate synthase/folylpolyglutamate synthase n=1 Tax=Blastopirellula sediminis TaxID=2894196 RepID=A0A9X1MQ43_9BACT|nr:folylpolyglutamate synthase/dihydrofolate synthase family protein [Blastopirellula sediminis]MCC9606397.1 bifunctional folylpolyglutamate synthase/dihydrofolate synthase [Blastopirellula sediminis]MCC9630305.1 bifunctional folylpolyglutamate synthase/dihydrofolate synthase [Blastopirellula sediminis]